MGYGSELTARVVRDRTNGQRRELPERGLGYIVTERRRNGIDLHPAPVRDLDAIAAEIGIETL